MSGILARASLRYLLRHPSQLVLAVLGVAVGVAVVVGIDLSAASARSAFDSAARAVNGRATHVVRAGPRGVPEDVFVRLALEPEAPPMAPVVARTLPLVSPVRRTMEILGVDPLREAPFRDLALDANAGNALMTVGAGAWLTERTARELGVTAGDELRFAVDGRERTLRLRGTLRARDAATDSALADVVLMDIASAQDLLALRGWITRIDVALEGEHGPAELERVRSLLPPGCALEPAGARAATMRAMTRAFDTNMRAFGFLALLVGVFLVYNTMTFSVVQRRPLWGTLRAVGATGRQIFRLVTIEALAIGVVGTALGIALGVQLARVSALLVEQTINDLYYVVRVDHVGLDGAVLIEAALLGVGATWLGALVPALDAMRTPPRAALDRALPQSRMQRSMGPLALLGAAAIAVGAALLLVESSSLVLGLAALFAVLAGAALTVPFSTAHLCALAAPIYGRLFGNLGRIAARGVTSHLSRSSVAIAALSIALSATAGIGILVDSFRSTVTAWLGSTLVSDIYVSSPSAHSNRDSSALAPELIARLLLAPEIEQASSFSDVELDLADGSRVFASAVELSARARAGYRLLAGDERSVWSAFDERDVVLVSESLARRRQLALGDTLILRTPRGETPFEVAAIFRDYSTDQGWAMFSRSAYRRWWRDERISAIGLFAAPGVDVERKVAELQGLVAPLELARIRSKRELVDATMTVFDRTFATTRVLRWLSFVVAGLGVIGALLAIELERRREIGVLRALGLTPAGLRRVVLGQTSLVGMIACALAVPLGVTIGWVLIEVVNARAFGWTVDMQVEPRVLLELVALGMSAALVAGIYPALHMSRLSPARTLRGE